MVSWEKSSFKITSRKEIIMLKIYKFLVNVGEGEINEYLVIEESLQQARIALEENLKKCDFDCNMRDFTGEYEIVKGAVI